MRISRGNNSQSDAAQRGTARVFRLLFPVLLFVLLSFLFAPASVSAKVIVTEIQYNPPGTDKGFEWLEIINEGEKSVEMTEYRLFEAAKGHRIKEGSGGSILEPDGIAVIAQDSAKFGAAYPDYDGMVLLSSFSLRQQGGIGEEIGIISGTGERDFTFLYAPDERSDGTGATLHISLEGEQIAAPATPGVIAVNPITLRNREAVEDPVPEPAEDAAVEQLVDEVLREEPSPLFDSVAAVSVETEHPVYQPFPYPTIQPVIVPPADPPPFPFFAPVIALLSVIATELLFVILLPSFPRDIHERTEGCFLRPFPIPGRVVISEAPFRRGRSRIPRPRRPGNSR